MEQQNTTMSGSNPTINQNDIANQKKTKTFYIVGIIVAIIELASVFLKLPIGSALINIISPTIFIAFILLFFNKYRYVGKQYLLGLFGTFIVLGVASFILTFLIIAIKK